MDHLLLPNRHIPGGLIDVSVEFDPIDCVTGCEGGDAKTLVLR